MKILKRIFNFIAALIIISCLGVLVCALNPKLSQSLASKLYGDGDKQGITDIISNLVNNDADDQNSDINSGNNNAISGDEINGDLNNNVSIGTLPDDVGKLTGYQPIEESEEQISDDIAKSIAEELDQGKTGESLSFDATMYPFYAMLDSDEQEIYKQIYANALETVSSFAPVTSIGTQKLKKAFEAVVNDHPELFYLETGYSVKYTNSNNVVEITLSYYTIANDLSTAKEKFEAAASPIISGALALTDDYSKEKYVHDALISLISYDDNATMSQSAYSALVNGKTVCAGYARANQYILQQLGIPCYYCTGYSGEDHAWNIVMLSDGFYNEDITWDDTNPASYSYFNKTDSDFVLTHVRTGMSVNLPKCNATMFTGIERGAPSNINVSNEDTSTDSGNDSSININPNPTEPLRYEDENSKTPEDTEDVAKKLAEIGLTVEDVIWSLEDYYTDCKDKMVKAGTGDQHFANIVPESLFTEIEKAYGNKEYENGYAQAALKELNMENFAIQIQAQRLGNGYYKLYHNIVTY